MNRLKLIIIGALILFASCEDDDAEFHFNLDYLIDTQWGIPDVIEVSPDVIDYDLSAPTVFYEDGSMIIGDSRYDFWRIRDAKSIHIERMAEIWFIIELTPEKLHVERSEYPSGKFILRCIYPAMEE